MEEDSSNIEEITQNDSQPLSPTRAPIHTDGFGGEEGEKGEGGEGDNGKKSISSSSSKKRERDEEEDVAPAPANPSNNNNNETTISKEKAEPINEEVDTQVDGTKKDVVHNKEENSNNNVIYEHNTNKNYNLIKNASARNAEEGTTDAMNETADNNNNNNDVEGNQQKRDPNFVEPIISNGMVEFPLSNIHKYLVCGLCSGYYKDPYTITECLHTFCKSCLFYSLACGCHECPDCKIYLGNDPLKVAVLDHALQELVDRIVCPEIVKEEEIREQEFYASWGIPLKPEHAAKEQQQNPSSSVSFPSSNVATAANINHPSKKKRHSLPSNNSASVSQNNNNNSQQGSGDELEFTLMPEKVSKGNGLPPLDRPCLRISGKLNMNQLKKYLLQKLSIPRVSHATFHLDILCNGVPLGDELSLGFVKRLLWPHESDLALTYRIASDVF